MVMPKGRFHARVHQQQGRITGKQVDRCNPEQLRLRDKNRDNPISEIRIWMAP